CYLLPPQKGRVSCITAVLGGLTISRATPVCRSVAQRVRRVYDRAPVRLLILLPNSITSALRIGKSATVTRLQYCCEDAKGRAETDGITVIIPLVAAIPVPEPR